MIGSSAVACGCHASDVEHEVDDGEDAVDDDEQDDARNDGARRRIADGRRARPPSAGRAGSRCRRSRIGEHERLDEARPGSRSASTALSTSCTNVTNGIANDCIVSAPPSMPTRSANSVEQRRHQQRGDDPRRDEEAHRIEAHRRQRVDLLVDASSCRSRRRTPRRSGRRAGSPSSAARARAASTRPIRSATKISAPKRFIGTADWNARIMPSRNEISATIGSASAPTRSQMRQTSSSARCADARPRSTSAAVSLADERRSASRDVAPDAGGGAADLLDRRAGACGSDRGRASSACGSNCCSSASNAGLQVARPRPAPSRGWRSEVDEAARCRRRRSSRRRPRRRRPACAALRRAARCASPQTPRIVFASRRPDSASDAPAVGVSRDRERRRRPIAASAAGPARAACRARARGRPRATSGS